MRRNIIKKVICRVLLVGILISVAICKKSITVNAKESSNEIGQILDLSKLEETTSIEEETEIRDIMNLYGLGDPGEVEKLIYVPLEENEKNEISDNESYVNPRTQIKNYYIKKIRTFNGAGPLLRNSWYVAPGGTMTVTETVSKGYEFGNAAQVEGGSGKVKFLIESSYSINFSKSISVSDSQNVEVATGCKKNVKAYVYETTYGYEVWEDKLLNDVKVGYGTWDKPIGILFVVGNNVSLG